MATINEIKPKFNVGDIVQYITDSTDRRKIEEVDTLCNMYYTDSSPIMFEIEDEWKVVVNAKDVEQKPAVEPIFNVGDWVANKLGDAWHIDSLDRKNYQVSDGKENYDYFPISKQDEMHLWSIKDTKDGDILSVEPVGGYQFPFVAIYKNRGLDFFSSYCFIGLNGKFYEGDTGHALDEIHPATKEQREILFSKMKEAGYVWNEETKELIVVQKKYKYDFGWCMECRRSMWIADAFEDPEEVYCTKKKIEIKRGDKIDCPYLK